MSTDGHRIKWRRQISKISIVWVGRTYVTDTRQTTDDRQTTYGRAIAYSEHESDDPWHIVQLKCYLLEVDVIRTPCSAFNEWINWQCYSMYSSVKSLNQFKSLNSFMTTAWTTVTLSSVSRDMIQLIRTTTNNVKCSLMTLCYQ